MTEERIPENPTRPQRHVEHGRSAYDRREIRVNPFRRSIVTLLKYVLPMVAVTLIALVVLWPKIEEVQESGFRIGFSTSPSDMMENVSMNRPRFFGVDSSHQPFTVTATEAIEQPAKKGQSEHVYLKEPQGDMTLTDGSWIALTANHGAYTQDDSKLDLTGQVNMYHDNGFEIHTEQALISMNEGKATGEKPVNGQGPFGTIKSDSGFELKDKGNVIRFLGNSKLKIFESALKGKS